jgi:hypothetical protein
VTGVVSLTVGAVTVGAGANAASVTGSPPQWSDSSDATYGTTSTDNVVGGTYLVAPVTGDATGLSALTLTIRQSFASGNTGYGARLSNVHFYIGETDIGAVSPANVNLGTIEDVTVDVTFDSPYTLADWAASVLAGTASVRVLPGSPTAVGPTNTVTVYELDISAAVLSPCFETLNFHNARKTNTPDVDTAGTEVWADGNLATSLGPDDTYGGWADLDAYSGPTALDLTVTVQASASSPSLAEVPFGIRVDSAGGSTDLWGGGRTGARASATGEPLDYLVPTDGSTYALSRTISDANILVGWATVADFYDQLRGTCRAEVWIDLASGDITGADVQIHELSLRVGHKCYVLNPLRRWPGGAATGPSRQWPRRITRRPGTH